MIGTSDGLKKCEILELTQVEILVMIEVHRGITARRERFTSWCIS